MASFNLCLSRIFHCLNAVFKPETLGRTGEMPAGAGMDSFDYVIIGAGSAGSVLADRLSADGRARVLVLEAGGSDRRPWIRLPIGYGKTFHDRRVNWCLEAEPEAALAGRRMYMPRGKVMGGSSSINGLVYSRGLPGDFDDWRAAGNPGWGWDDVAPVFALNEGEGEGEAGTVRAGALSLPDRSAGYHPIRRHYLAAAAEAGLPALPGDRALWSEGVGPYRITTRRGLRHSAADAFLRPAMRRANLEVRLHAHVERIVFEDGRAAGVVYSTAGQARQVRCRGEVILAAGAVKSPQILQLSGLGPGALLAGLGVPVLVDNPAIGGGLQDHLGVDYLFRASEPTLNQVLGTWRGNIRAALEFVLRRAGPLSLSVNQMGGMVRSGADRARADVQLYFNPLSYTTIQRGRRRLLRPDPWPGFAFGFNACRPTSRGRVDIASPDPAARPRIVANYLSTNADLEDVVRGGRLVERMLATAAMTGLIAAENGFSPRGASDAAILEDFRQRASSVFHLCGTCRMAPRGDGGVVDPALRLHGVRGLRVADASIFPNITSANTNAPTIMVARKAADMILAR